MNWIKSIAVLAISTLRMASGQGEQLSPSIEYDRISRIEESKGERLFVENIKLLESDHEIDMEEDNLSWDTPCPQRYTSSIDQNLEREFSLLLQTQEESRIKPAEMSPSVIDLARFIGDTSLESPMAQDLGMYSELPITDDAKRKIGDILNTMADNNVFELLFQKKRLEQLGSDIEFVHPIRFLGTVFSNPQLVHCMLEIRKSSFKWKGFINGFGARFRAEIRANNVNQYLPGLATLLNVSKEHLQAYTDYKDFQGMVLYLMSQHHLIDP